MTPKTNLEHLAPAERRALVEFVQLLKERFNGLVKSALLFGSKARGQNTPDSDLDVLVVVDSDDCRLHKQIRYLAADIGLEYGLNLSPRVWSVSHHREVKELQTLLYQNIHRDGISLLQVAGVAEYCPICLSPSPCVCTSPFPRVSGSPAASLSEPSPCGSSGSLRAWLEEYSCDPMESVSAGACSTIITARLLPCRWDTLWERENSSKNSVTPRDSPNLL